MADDVIRIPGRLITNVAFLSKSGSTVTIDCASPEAAEAVLDYLDGSVTMSSGNVFADLDLPDAEFLMNFADLTAIYDDAMAVMRAAEPILIPVQEDAFHKSEIYIEDQIRRYANSFLCAGDGDG